MVNTEIVPEIPSNHYINNAGLILIHPFLKQLFENCKLLNKDNTINDPEMAAHLLHYIATAKEQDYEHEMVFEKLLCNIPVNQTINRNITLSEEIKNHANEMLRAVLDNWEVMKNSSVALLQNEYLQRPGKIIFTGDNPKILVERKTQDILLDKIPWNLGIVKLAWKNKVIFVDW
ncbi:contractile injection system tape measure protein [Flavobacterium sp. LBUM151]